MGGTFGSFGQRCNPARYFQPKSNETVWRWRVTEASLEADTFEILKLQAKLRRKITFDILCFWRLLLFVLPFGLFIGQWERTLTSFWNSPKDFFRDLIRIVLLKTTHSTRSFDQTKNQSAQSIENYNRKTKSRYEKNIIEEARVKTFFSPLVSSCSLVLVI